MPEYLAPGVYVEETSFRSKSIEGVSTSTAGFVGPARWGPVSGDPELLTSLADFERIYGGLDDLQFSDQSVPQPNYLAHAVRAFFEEGGERLYISRVFNFDTTDAGFVDEDVMLESYAATTASSPPGMRLRARFPGLAGAMRVIFTVHLGPNSLASQTKPGGSGREFVPTRLNDFDVVFIRKQESEPVLNSSPPRTRFVWKSLPSGTDGLFLVRRVPDPVSPTWKFRGTDKTDHRLSDILTGLDPTSTKVEMHPLTVTIDVSYPIVGAPGAKVFRVPVSLGDYSFDPRSTNGLTATFTRKPNTRQQALTIPFGIETPSFDTFDRDSDDDRNDHVLEFLSEILSEKSMLDPTKKVLDHLTDDPAPPDGLRAIFELDGGSDGAVPNEANYEGNETDFRDYIDDVLQMPKNGLLAFEAVEGISIVAAPGYSALYKTDGDRDRVFAIHRAVITHCEKMRYRVAVLDTAPQQLVSDALAFRNLTSSEYAALYYPWVTVAHPLRDERLNLPPSGFVAGIYARNDTEHAVFKAPANEVVRLAIDFEQRLNKAQQDVLNPEGVNCFRFFPGHGFLLWGARTISDDPEWKYISVRRYFAYLEHSIDRGTQWVVFENNSKQLWDNVRHTIEDFLLNEWKMGALMGDKPEQAYFVRCDLSTMTQNDLDNGRLVCLIGVAVVKPAEFVIFRIGQWTADRKF